MGQFIQALDVVVRRLLAHLDAITFKLRPISVKLARKDCSIEKLRLQCEQVNALLIRPNQVC